MCEQAWRELWEALREMEEVNQQMRECIRQREPRSFIEEEQEEDAG